MPLAIAVLCAGVAGAATQPGTTTQPGVTTGPGAPQAQPGITTVVAPTPAQDAAGIAPTSDYAPVRPVPHRTYVAPLQPERLHAPVPVPQVAPIAPPADVIRVGDMSTPRPAWMPKETANAINAPAAGWESQISTFARSVGVAPSRADSIASAAVAGAVGAAASYPILTATYYGVLTVGTSGLMAIPIVLTLPVMAVLLAPFVTGSAATGGLIGAGVGGLR